jgi:hypothetical protein
MGLRLWMQVPDVHPSRMGPLSTCRELIDDFHAAADPKVIRERGIASTIKIQTCCGDYFESGSSHSIDFEKIPVFADEW